MDLKQRLADLTDQAMRQYGRSCMVELTIWPQPLQVLWVCRVVDVTRAVDAAFGVADSPEVATATCSARLEMRARGIDPDTTVAG